MKNSRHRAREFVLQGLYQWLVAGGEPGPVEAQLRASEGFAKCSNAWFTGLWRGITSHFEALVAAFAPFLDRDPSELSPIEKCVLAIGAWELLHEPGIPYRVAINEAVELAKSYGGTDGHKYVNGVLDKLAARARPAEVSPARATS